MRLSSTSQMRNSHSPSDLVVSAMSAATAIPGVLVR